MNEDWRDTVSHARIGFLLGLLFANGYEADEINNNLTAMKYDGTWISGGFFGLLTFDEEEDWIVNFGEVNRHTTDIGGGGGEFVLSDFVRDNLSVASFFGSGDREKIKEWLTRQKEIGILSTNRLTPIQCQELHRLGYEPKDLFNGTDTVGGVAIDGTAGQVYAYDPLNDRWLAGFTHMEQFHKIMEWHRTVDSDVPSPTYASADSFTRNKLNLFFGFGSSFLDKELADAWLSRQEELGLVYGANRLTGAQVQELHKLGWNPQDLGIRARNWRAIHPVSGNPLNGINAILAVGKLAVWYDAIDAAAPNAVSPIYRFPLKKRFDSGFGFGGFGDKKKMEEWLSARSRHGISPTNLTPIQVQQLHMLGWDPSEIISVGAGVAGTRDFTVINPFTEQPLTEVGFAAISGRGLKSDLWNGELVTDHVVPPLEPRPNALIWPNDSTLINLWLAKRKELIDANPTQKAEIENQLSVGNIKSLHLENWDPGDISWDENGAGGKGVLIALTSNGDRYEAEDFAGISALEGKRKAEKELPKLRRKNFRAAAKRASAINKDGRGRSPNSAHDKLWNDNELNNFIIDQYFQKWYLSPEDAVDAYNNGWIYGLEVGLNRDRSQIGVSKDGGKKWSIFDWKKTSRTDYLTSKLNEEGRKLMDAFQIDDTGVRWIPPLSDFEKDFLRRGRRTTRKIRIDRLRENYLDKVREIAATAPGSPAALAFGTVAAPVPDSDFIIEQYFYDEEITPQEVVQAYNNDWIYGLEVSMEGGRKKCWFLDNADDECILRDINWTTTKRGIPYNALSPEKKAKADALQLNYLGERWNPELIEKECKRILNAPDASTATSLRETIYKERGFIQDFWDKHGPVFMGDPNAPTMEVILTYFGKNLTGRQAAQLFKGDPQVFGSELSQGTQSDEVIFNGKVYKTIGKDVAGEIIAAKQAKIDADEAAAEAARQAAKLAEVQTAAETAIKTAQQAADNKPEVTDAELNQYLKDTEKILNDNLKTWLEYIKQAETKDEVKARKSKVLSAIKEVRKIKRGLAVARTRAVNAVKNHWKNKSSDKSKNGLVNGKKMTEVLGSDWEKELNELSSPDEIENTKKGLIAKIEAEKAKESKQKAPKKKKPTEKLTDQKVKEIFQNVLGNTAVEIDLSVIKSWQSYNNPKSALKNTKQVEEFIEEIKNDEAGFVKHLEEQPSSSKPTGQNEREKITNFLAKQKSETVIKVIFSYKLKDDTFRVKTEIEMESQQNDDEQPLDETIYPQKDGEYTREAMVRYLYEKKTCQPHRFSATEEESEDSFSFPTDSKGHWDEWKNWYIGGIILLLLVAGLVVGFWNKLVGLVKTSKKNK
jgi:hypothetical protein